jgi:glycosyltransferase involved in cell wall biosynthesis
VPTYLAALDVCLIPYRRTTWTAGCFPAKLLEYLASGRPVVATDLPGLAPYADVINLASDPRLFVAACRRVVGEDSEAAARQRRTLAHAASLQARCDVLEQLMASLPD